MLLLLVGMLELLFKCLFSSHNYSVFHRHLFFKLEQVIVFSEVPSGLPQWLSGKESACKSGASGDTSSIPRSGRSPGGGHGNPLQYSQLENPLDRGAWQAMVHSVAKSQTQLKRLSTGVFLESPCSFYDPIDAGNLISGSFAISKSICTSGSSQFTY